MKIQNKKSRSPRLELHHLKTVAFRRFTNDESGLENTTPTSLAISAQPSVVVTWKSVSILLSHQTLDRLKVTPLVNTPCLPWSLLAPGH